MSEKVSAAAISQQKLPDSAHRKLKVTRLNHRPPPGLTSVPSSEPDSAPENQVVSVEPKGSLDPVVPASAASAAKASRSFLQEVDGDTDSDPDSDYQKVKLPRRNVSRPSQATAAPTGLPADSKKHSVPLAASSAKASRSSLNDTDGDIVSDSDSDYPKVKLPRIYKNQPSRLTPAPSDLPFVVPASRTVPSDPVAAPILPSSTPAAEAPEAPEAAESSRVDSANPALEASAPATSISHGPPGTGGQGGGARPAEPATPSSRYKKRLNQSLGGVEQLTPTSKRWKFADRSYRASLGGGVARIAAITLLSKDPSAVDAASLIEDDAAWFEKRRMTLTPARRRPSLGASVRRRVTPGPAGQGGWSLQRCALMQEPGQAGSEAGKAGVKQAGHEEVKQTGEAVSKQVGEAGSIEAGQAGEGGLKTMATGEKDNRDATTAEQGQASGEASKQGADGPVELTKEFLESRMNVIFAQETCNADQKPLGIARQVKACLKRCYLASMLDIRAFETSTNEGNGDEDENAGKADGMPSGKRVERATEEQTAVEGRKESLAAVLFRLQGLREIKEDLLKEMQEIEAVEKREEAEEEESLQNIEEEVEKSDGGEGDVSDAQLAELIEETLPVVKAKNESTRLWTSTTLALCERAAEVEQRLLQAHPTAVAAAVDAAGDDSKVTTGATVRGPGGFAGVPLAVLTPQTAARGLANLGHPDMPADLE
ncbi:hypothetical protein CLOM_g10957 [Closterium sp. NIES-68]|nr:hypothetical protein CLOM_g10957 [Closterium sp. NIES-68]GJP67498.1 hypothetical protein CLOP_g24314 [Closterium sp. NIES-67]